MSVCVFIYMYVCVCLCIYVCGYICKCEIANTSVGTNVVAAAVDAFDVVYVPKAQ
jgi:hypothetical protein